MSGQEEIYDLDAPVAEQVIEDVMESSEKKPWIDNGDGSRTLPLKHPFRVQYKGANGTREETIESLRLRRVNGGDIVAMMQCKHDDAKVLTTLFTRLTNKPLSFFERLDVDDVLSFTQTVADFLEKFQAVGRL